jgi:hypothetical protein
LREAKERVEVIVASKAKSGVWRCGERGERKKEYGLWKEGRQKGKRRRPLPYWDVAVI